jgi:hypothetical protein
VIWLVAAVALAAWCPGVASAATGWVVQSVPAGAFDLSTVSCTAADSCLAVNDTDSYSWTGGSWTDATPLATVPGEQGPLIDQVSCTAANDCMATGSYQSPSSSAPLAEHWNGTTWTMEQPPAIPSSVSTMLNGVSCVTAANCMSVGTYQTTTGIFPLAEHWNGSTWTASFPAAGPDSYGLNGVSCTRNGHCIALNGRELDIWNGSTWASTNAVPTTGASLVELGPVTYLTRTRYLVIESSQVTTASPNTLQAEIWNGTAWTSQPIPVPAGSFATVLGGISCATASRCTAVGYFGPGSALAETWDGSTWTIRHTASPQYRKELMAVSCTAVQTCSAVGMNLPNRKAGTGYSALAERENG